MATCKEHYEMLAQKCQEVVDRTFTEDTEGKHAANHLFANDLEKWCEVLSLSPEANLIKSAAKRYQFSLLSASQGKYRNAFSDLRGFVEHSLAAVWFSGHVVEYQLWAQGKRDIYWAELTDLETGIFSQKYVSAFFSELSSESKHYNSIAKQVYRECSEYVHGNQNLEPQLNDEIGFNKEIFDIYHEKVETACLVVTFCLVLRYLKNLSAESLRAVEAQVLEKLGSLQIIRDEYSKIR